jgi:hypothetical protein
MFICTGPVAVQHRGEHGYAELGKSVRKKARVAVRLGTGRNLRPVQDFSFLGGEAEHEVLRETVEVALHLFVQALGGAWYSSARSASSRSHLPKITSKRFCA